MVTTIALDIPKKRLKYINDEIRKGYYSDLNDFLTQFVNEMFDDFGFNKQLERHVRDTIKKGKKLPFPIIESDDDIEKYLDEIKSEPIEVTDIRSYVQDIYDHVVTRGAPRTKHTV